MTRRKNTAQENTNQKLTLECPTFDEAIELFIKDQKIKNRTPRTLQWHRENFSALKKAFSAQSIPWDLKAISRNNIKHNFILYSLENYHNKPTTINNRMKTYKSFFKFMCQEGYLEKDITTGIDKLKEVKKIIITLDEDEILRILKSSNPKTFTGLRDLTIIKLLLDTGIRLMELVLLELDDLFFHDNLIKVFGKTQKERFVPLSPELKKVLKEYLSVRGDLPTRALFVTLDNQPIKRRTVQDRLMLISKKARITKQCSPHIWRHTFAKYYILNGGDPFSLKAILGHADWGMVHRYVDMFGSEVKRQHSKASPLKNLF